MLILPVLAGLCLLLLSFCAVFQVSSPIIASWVFLNIFHCSFGRLIFVLSLKERVVYLKFIVSPIYSCLSNIWVTVIGYQ